MSELWTSICEYMTGVGWRGDFVCSWWFLLRPDVSIVCLCFYAKERRGFLIWRCGTHYYYYYCIANGHVWRRIYILHLCIRKELFESSLRDWCDVLVCFSHPLSIIRNHLDVTETSIQTWSKPVQHISTATEYATDTSRKYLCWRLSIPLNSLCDLILLGDQTCHVRSFDHDS
jgi:hypothetical protein